MSEIPYYFDTPVPKYFRESGWFKNENTFKFVTWAFSKCQNISHTQVINGKEIILQAYEFIAGRLTSPKECFLTEEAFRHQLKVMLEGGFLKKTPNSTPNKFTCYIWLTERFYKTKPQPHTNLHHHKNPPNPPQHTKNK